MICEDFSKVMIEDFLKTSWSTVSVLVNRVGTLKQQNQSRQVTLFRCLKGQKVTVKFEGNRFFLRGSVEYTNPQLTVEEVQGIIGIRLLEVSANYFDRVGLHEPNGDDVVELCELLRKPPEGYIVPFLLNTDDVEADRYSINPLRKSIVESGQSAFPVDYVKTDQLKIDSDFAKKYDGKLISQGETELIASSLKACDGTYLDFVDYVKYTQLESLSEFFGMNLTLYALRMPLSILRAEEKDGLLHYIIGESHRDYEAVNKAYSCMGRSMTKRTTLLTVPHSKKGYGSKRAARGKIHFQDSKLLDVAVKYKTTLLYPNAIDPQDVAVAECDDNFSVAGEKLSDYSFRDTPSSPQFFLYSMGSPEDAALWHGVGAFGSPQLLQSASSARSACRRGRFIRDLSQKYNINLELPLQFNLTPESMWNHPVYRNIDASIGSIANLEVLPRRGMKIEYLSTFK